MGISSLWKLLAEEGILRKLVGSRPEEHSSLLAELDGKVIAIDLSAWIMQADQQMALSPHFSRTERCMKVALERSIQWLRHGCLPVIVVEGTPPAEKQATIQARFAARNGFEGGGRGSASFLALGRAVGVLLSQLGLPVFYAPGEAEAVCVALERAGAVHACASFDSDTLVYGAQRVYHTLKLNASKASDCEVLCCELESIRGVLGINKGGQVALSVVAMLAGSDYDIRGTSGVGSISSLRLIKFLLGPDAEDDSGLMSALDAAVARPADPGLAMLTKCTGCKRCGHEGHRKSRVPHHTKQNPCEACERQAAASQQESDTEEQSLEEASGTSQQLGEQATQISSGVTQTATGDQSARISSPARPKQRAGVSQYYCVARNFTRCECAFHRTEDARAAEAVLARIRADPAPLESAKLALAVFQRQSALADAYVAGRLRELGGQSGDKLVWLHRPRVLGVWAEIERRRMRLTWDLVAVRSKLMPLLLEWDLRNPFDNAEFRAVEIQKVHGARGKAAERTSASSAAIMAAFVGKKKDTESCEDRRENDNRPCPPGKWRYVLRWERVPGASLEVYPETIAVSTKKIKGARNNDDDNDEESSSVTADDGDAATQEEEVTSVGTPKGNEGEAQVQSEEESLTMEQIDQRWLASAGPESRTARISLVHGVSGDLEQAYFKRLESKAAKKKGSSSSGGTGTVKKKTEASPTSKGLLSRLLVQQRARALLAPTGGKPAARRPSNSAVPARGLFASGLLQSETKKDSAAGIERQSSDHTGIGNSPTNSPPIHAAPSARQAMADLKPKVLKQQTLISSTGMLRSPTKRTKEPEPRTGDDNPSPTKIAGSQHHKDARIPRYSLDAQDPDTTDDLRREYVVCPSPRFEDIVSTPERRGGCSSPIDLTQT